MRADTKVGRGEILAADKVAAGSAVHVVGFEEIARRDARLACRLQELGVRPGVAMEIGRKTAGGGRVVRVDGCRYAIDCATLKCVEVRL